MRDDESDRDGVGSDGRTLGVGIDGWGLNVTVGVPLGAPEGLRLAVADGLADVEGVTVMRYTMSFSRYTSLTITTTSPVLRVVTPMYRVSIQPL